MGRYRILHNAVFACLLFIVMLPASAAVDLSFGGAKDSVQQGERFQLEWIVTNNGSSTESNLAVQLPWQTGIASFSSSLLDGGTCPNSCDPGETAIWTIGSLAAGESRTAYFAPVVSNSAPSSPITWTANLLQGATILESVDYTLRIASNAFAQLNVDSDRSLVSPGDNVQYRITFGNTGSATLNNSSLTVQIPSGVVFQSAPGASVSGNQISWSLGNVSSGTVGRRYLNVQVANSANPGDVIELDDAVLSGIFQGIAQTSVARHVVSIGSSPLSISLKAQEGVISAGERYQMELVVTNTGSTVQQGVTARTLYPVGASSVSSGSFTDGGVCPNSCDSGEHLIWSFGNLLPGESRSARFAPIQATSVDEGRPIRWQARVESNSQSARREYATLGMADLAPRLTLQSSHSKVNAGDTFTYVINYGNRGNAPLSNANIVFPIPEGTSLVDAGGAVVSNGVATWSVGDVGAGAVLRKNLIVQASSSAVPGDLVSADGVELSGIFFGIEQMSTAEHTIVIGDTPLQFSIRAHTSSARIGQAVQMELLVSNNGSGVEQGVTARVTYPTEFASISSGATLEGATCPNSCDPGEQIVWSIGNLLPGETRSINFAPRVRNSLPVGDTAYWQGVVSNNANIERRADTAIAITVIAPTLSIWSDKHLVDPGETFTYTFAVGNRGFAAISNPVLTVPLPPELQFVSSTTASFSNGVLSWQIAPLIDNGGPFFDGGVAILNATVRASSTLSSGDQIEITGAEFSGESFGVLESTTGAHVTTIGDSPLELDMTLTPEFRLPGETMEVELEPFNVGSQVAQNVTMTLLFPFDINSLSPANMDGATCPNTCDPSEHPIWTLGNLLPGATNSQLIDFNPIVSNSAVVGRTIQWQARVQVNDGSQRRVEQGVAIGSEIVIVGVTTQECNGMTVTVNIGAGEVPTTGDNVILGTEGADTIVTGSGNDTICAGGGNDTIDSGGGNDWIDGGDGADVITARSGTDMIFGGAGNDTILGGGGDDTIEGEAGNDMLFGQPGNDLMDGGTGVDGINGGGGEDTIHTGTGATVGSSVFVTGSAGNDTIFGGPDADRIIGSNGADVINGEGGDDDITGGVGRDIIDGGDGNDTIRGQSSQDIINGGSGNDDINGGTGNDTINGGSGNDVINGAGDDDVLRGDGGADSIKGGSGDDRLVGGADGGDLCDGQSGTDSAVASCETIVGVP